MSTRRFFVPINVADDSSDECEREANALRRELEAVAPALRDPPEAREDRSARLARMLPKLYSLRVLPANTLVYRGSATQHEADAEYPPRYTVFSQSEVMAGQNAIRGTEPYEQSLLREFRTRRDLVLLNLDAMTYRGAYRESDIAAMAAAFDEDETGVGVETALRIMDRMNLEHFEGADYDEEPDGSSDAENDGPGIDEARRTGAAQLSLNAISWLADFADTFVSENDMIGLLRRHWPELDGFVRNESTTGARELVIADPTGTLERLRYRRFTEEQWDFFDQSTGGIAAHTVGIVDDATTEETSGQPIALRWAAEIDARYTLLSDANNGIEAGLLELIRLAIVANRSNQGWYNEHQNYLRLAALYLGVSFPAGFGRDEFGSQLAIGYDDPRNQPGLWRSYADDDAPAAEQAQKRKRSRARRRVK